MKKVVKVILKTLLIIVALFLLIVLALQIPSVQNFVKDKAVVYLEKKIKTKVEIGSIEIGLPKKIVLRDFYFEDQAKDTLLAGKSLKVDISLFQLFNNKVDINSIDLENITAHIKVSSDSVYNFDYIIKAFETGEPKKEEGSIEILVKNINLNDIKFSYKDAIAQKNIELFVNHFDTNIDKFDLKNLRFDVPEINLKGLKLNLNQDLVEATKYTTEKIEAEAETNFLKLNLKNIHLENIDVNYKDAITHIDAKIRFKNLKTKVKTIDLEKQIIVLNSIELNKTSGYFTLTKQDEIVPKTTKNSSSLPWKIDVSEISITDFKFDFDNNNEIKTPSGIDYNHLKLNGLNLKGKSFVINDNAYSGTIDSFIFKEKSGFQLDELSTAFSYTSKSASLIGLLLKTPQTTLQNTILTSYPSIESISENPENLKLDIDLKDSRVGFKDVLLLFPQLNSNDIFKNNPHAIVNFNANVKGLLGNLKINTFNADRIGNTKVDIKGTITGLPNVDKSVFDINILNFESSSKDIYAFTPNNTIPNTIQLPEIFNVRGNFKGSINNFDTNLDLKSSFGNAIVDATFNQSRKNNEKYSADASVENFDLGKFLKNDQFGKVTVNATIIGRSLDPSTATATLSSKIVTAKFNDYNYKNITINGSLDNGQYLANVSSSDSNLNFVLDAKGASNSDKPTLDLKLNLELVDLNKLNLHEGPLKMKGDITANFEDLNPDNLNGTLKANNFLIALEKEQFPLDNISIRAISNIEKDSIILKSQFANGLIEGNYKLSTISNQLTNSISKYYDLDKKDVKNKEDQNLDFEFIIKDNPITKKIIPKIIELSEITLNGSYNSVNDSIVINASIPRLNYANNELSNGVLDVRTQDNVLQYDLSLSKIKNAQFEIQRTTLIGKLEDNTVNYALNIKDASNKDKYIISGVFKDSMGASTISLNPEKLLLNYEDWKIDETNQIKLAKNGILVSNFKIQNNQQSFSIQSETDEISSPIIASFENFKLESLTSIAKFNFEIGGTINGETTVKNIMLNPLFIADLDIENFTIKKDTVGNLIVKVDNQTTNLYKANVTLKGLQNDLNIDGNYNINNESLDFSVNIQKLQMASLQPFTLENLKESEGYLNGKLDVTGKASNPNVNGNIKFNSVGFKVVPLNSKFNLINDKIVFNTNKIVFDDFKLKDENGNPLSITGFINSQDYTNLGFNLNVVANNFRAVNSKAKDNDLFYGELYLDNNLGIKGTLESPIIDGTVKINADTKFSIVLPQSDPSIADREGIVEFIDQDQPVLISIEDPTKQISQTEVKGIDASVNIVVDKKAEISIIIDKANGDYLKLQGEAELTGGIDPSGKTTLTGKYEFTGGAYEMNFNLIKRKFEIQPESYILWTGEPTTANVNITAVYKVDASPLDLVDDQLVGITAETRNTYKQRVPFETNLIMKGELLQPEITFDIILPDGNNNISTEIINTTQAKLEQIRRDEDALNKQVFALLLLNRFIGENPFESEAGGTSGTYLAKQSVSKILSQQLNNLAGDLIKGFELDFDLQATEDYSSGEKEERTDLDVGLSKQLFNDRLKVTVGSSFGLEGTPQENEQATNIAGDVTADYLITKDGRYKLRAYRKNNYQVALQGQVIETGVAFIITMNYDKFRELFYKKRKGNRKNKRENEK
ncbi:translocation/assembly module TamB domain-containing protein [Mariniflexile litorale]|uniref:Translocation/assembly module TamB domain-containing protein n=1 Tax=Mariniflexile litorale TaxID=3045158 RepID=A0AAU7EH44_9FLAO|nr:translocation/assembly module TamB domain-containing protein [Mariniflexile sp. KMM 9835]MDQ8211876.1 translocation/assembly module TamB domain-containing protein [Mariniflexile sp. KMM 9835]